MESGDDVTFFFNIILLLSVICADSADL